MAALLLSETFDRFSFIEGTITTFNTFSINGRIHAEFYRQLSTDNEDAEAIVPGSLEYSLWKDLRGYCFSIIKGKRTPLSFHLVFSLTPDNIRRLLEQEALPFSPTDVQGLYLNFKYDGTSLTCTTGTSMNLFTMDKSLEHSWDAMVQKFFTKHAIDFELLS